MSSPAAALLEPLLGLARRQRRFLEATWLRRASEPGWHTPNRVVLDHPAYRLRDFSAARPAAAGDPLPVLVVPPEVNRSTIVDFGPGQSLVGCLQAAGFGRVAVLEWKSATSETAARGVDDSLRSILACIEALGGRVHLVGVCQGGWESACVVALEPRVAASLTLVAAPIDFAAGDGLLKWVVRFLPLAFYQALVAGGGGRMAGELISQGFDNLMPFERYWLIPLSVYNHVDDPDWLERHHRLGDWYRSPKDLPGPMYLTAVARLFQANELVRGRFVALGRRVDLARIDCPLALLAGSRDHITPPAQVWAAAGAVSSKQVLRREIPAGHVGTFMGRAALGDHWPAVLAWLMERDPSRAVPGGQEGRP